MISIEGHNFFMIVSIFYSYILRMALHHVYVIQSVTCEP